MIDFSKNFINHSLCVFTRQVVKIKLIYSNRSLNLSLSLSLSLSLNTHPFMFASHFMKRTRGFNSFAVSINRIKVTRKLQSKRNDNSVYGNLSKFFSFSTSYLCTLLWISNFTQAALWVFRDKDVTFTGSVQNLIGNLIEMQ